MKITIQKTGRWLHYDKETYMCSICGQRSMVSADTIRHHKYCFNCGAKMDKEKRIKI